MSGSLFETQCMYVCMYVNLTAKCWSMFWFPSPALLNARFGKHLKVLRTTNVFKLRSLTDHHSCLDLLCRRWITKTQSMTYFLIISISFTLMLRIRGRSQNFLRSDYPQDHMQCVKAPSWGPEGTKNWNVARARYENVMLSSLTN